MTMKKIGFFQDNQGNYSMMRLAAFIVIVIGSVSIIVWSIVAIVTLTVPPFPEYIAYIMLGVFGVGKPLQKFFERDSNEQLNNDSE